MAPCLRSTLLLAASGAAAAGGGALPGLSAAELCRRTPAAANFDDSCRAFCGDDDFVVTSQFGTSVTEDDSRCQAKCCACSGSRTADRRVACGVAPRDGWDGGVPFCAATSSALAPGCLVCDFEPGCAGEIRGPESSFGSAAGSQSLDSTGGEGGWNGLRNLLIVALVALACGCICVAAVSYLLNGINLSEGAIGKKKPKRASQARRAEEGTAAAAELREGLTAPGVEVARPYAGVPAAGAPVAAFAGVPAHTVLYNQVPTQATAWPVAVAPAQWSGTQLRS
eukprot:TRINITY_DN14587_c0_g2_i2.p2 TRINITY_DN14587_c0_g2~~TRINITY_DN14587_c0_g2_i2.p2  ORF type:complete len:317 (+),score=51.90 TRINITY_DN14587_c0_g2_i2:106-951(+)